MSFQRFSPEGKGYLQHRMDKWAEAIAAHLLGSLAGITSDHDILAMAMDEFQPILREQLEKVLDDIDVGIQANGLMEDFELGNKNGAIFSVVLDGVADPDKKFNVMLAVRDIIFMDLGEAKEFVEAAPQFLKHGVTAEYASAMKKKLEEAGASVCIKGFAGV